MSHLFCSPTLLCSCPGAHSQGRQSRRVVEVHRQHHFRLQARREPHPPRGPVPVGPCQRCGLQVSQDQTWEEVPAVGEWRGLSRAERSGGRQRQPGYPVEGHVGTQAQEVPAAREERQVQEAIEDGEDTGERRGIQEQSWAGHLKKKKC